MNFKHIWQEYQQGLKLFGECIASIINFILLSIVYILGIGITAIIAKIVGKHFLLTKMQKGSYWMAVKKKKSMEDDYRQF